jgi:hypothetical protein
MGIARLEKLDRILAVPAGEPLGLVDRGHETLPADRAVDGGERIAVFGFGCDQLVTHPGEETDGPVDQAAVVAEGGQLAALGAASSSAIATRIPRRRPADRSRRWLAERRSASRLSRSR